MKKSRRTQLQIKQKKWRRKLLLLIPGTLLLVVLAGAIYVSSLLGLVQEPDESGDPLLHESDIFNPEDYVTAAPTGTHAPEATPGATQGTGHTTAAETTVDPAVLYEQAHRAALEGLPMAAGRQVYNLLLIGTDRRPGEINGRADAILILSVNRRTQQIHIVSLMRALFVLIPGREVSMINASFSWGGARLLINTIEQNFRIPIDDYLLIDFDGFRQAIDAVGGIPIRLSQAEADYLTSKRPETEIQAGENHLDGDLALWYTRIRQIDSDFSRTGRQRVVIETLIRRLGRLSPGELDQVARRILPHIKSNRSGSSLLRLVSDAYRWRNFPVSQLLIPLNGTYDLIVVRNAQMVLYEVQANVDRLQAALYR